MHIAADLKDFYAQVLISSM